MSPLVYGAPPSVVAPVAKDALQVSPLIPGAVALESLDTGSADAATVPAPPGTIERRYVLALALRALAPGASLVALAPKDRGGSRLRSELEAFGCEVGETSKAHHRICYAERPSDLTALDAAMAAGAPRRMEALDLWTQPGVFSWDRIDPGTALLIELLPELAGRGADLGCGLGVLARAVLASSGVEHLTLIDIDRRAVEAARRNIADPRVEIVWADARRAPPVLENLDFVVMNPPFHDGGAEDRALGQAFIRRAHAALRKGGTLWITANRHLPYEGVLGEVFEKVERRAEANGFKVYEARR